MLKEALVLILVGFVVYCGTSRNWAGWAKIMVVLLVTGGWLLILHGRASSAETTTRLYGMRGLLGGALGYSLGVDSLAQESRAQGVRPSAVKPHWRWNEIAATAAANYRNDLKKGNKSIIILVGHSMGGDTVTDVAEELQIQRIPVAVAIYLDPTPLVGAVPVNVRRAVDYRHLGFGLGGGSIVPADGFKGSFINRGKYIDHVALDDDPDVHSAALCEMVAAIANVVPNCLWEGASE